jgi:mRNA interferase HigB
MRIISRKTLRLFWENHADAEQALKTWFQEVGSANWENLNALKNEYPNASILVDNRVVFNIKGNKYRVIVKFNFHYQMAWIRFVGTHAEYDKIDAKTI